MSSTRRTSAMAYQTIMENGLLSKRREEVYEWLYHNGPATAKQVYNSLLKGKHINPSSYLSRLAELRDMGVLYEVGTTNDENNGMEVILWDVTEALPSKEVKDPIEVILKQAEKAEAHYLSVLDKLASHIGVPFEKITPSLIARLRGSK